MSTVLTSAVGLELRSSVVPRAMIVGGSGLDVDEPITCPVRFVLGGASGAFGGAVVVVGASASCDEAGAAVVAGEGAAVVGGAAVTFVGAADVVVGFGAVVVVVVGGTEVATPNVFGSVVVVLDDGVVVLVEVVEVVVDVVDVDEVGVVVPVVTVVAAEPDEPAGPRPRSMVVDVVVDEAWAADVEEVGAVVAAFATVTGEKAKIPHANVTAPSAKIATRLDCRQWAVVFDLNSSPRSAVPGEP